jgi:hypothetical protein
MGSKSIQFDKITKMEMGYLIGLFMGDGYRVHDKKYRHYTIEFYLHRKRNEMIQKYLIEILKRLGLNVCIQRDKRYLCNRVKIYSKEMMGSLNLDAVNKGEPEIDTGFVSGMIDAEGYVNHKKSSVSIVNTDKKTLEICKEILKRLGINSTIKQRVKARKDKKRSYILYISYKIKDINTNSLKIRSVPDS